MSLSRKSALGSLIAHSRDANVVKLATEFKTLIDKPDDAVASLAVGKYFCFVKADFEHGLPLLSKSAHATLSKLAKDDLANPGEPPAQSLLGDAWWDAGEKIAEADAKRGYQERAVYWYNKALPALKGLVKVKVETRMITMAKANVPVKSPSALPNSAAGTVTSKGIVSNSESVKKQPSTLNKPSSTSLSPEELQAQNDFKKAYANPDRDARKAALKLLLPAYHISSWQMLANVVSSDPDEIVRVHAMGTLAREPARNSSLAHMMVQLFSAVKPTADQDLRAKYAKEMVHSEFKYEIAAALEDTIVRSRYPDLVVYTTNQGGTIGNADVLRKIRANFRLLLDCFNVMAKSDVNEASPTVPAKIKQWWEANQLNIAKMDKDLEEKYKKEDLAK